MSDEADITRAIRRIDALELANGRLEARCGELAAEVALVNEANGCLQERMAKLEADFAALTAEIQKEREYRQTGKLSQKTPVDRARTTSDDMRGIR